MSKQLHKNFTDGQVKSLFEKYSKKEIKLIYILQILRIKRSRFFELLTRYRKDPDNFSIQYKRNTSNYRIDRAQRNNFYFLRPKRKAHDKEIITNYPGELIQHDSSHHQFAPYAANKWYLITSLDDYSRLILYAVLVERETTWEHILALEYVLIKYGFPLAYYVDSLLVSIWSHLRYHPLHVFFPGPIWLSSSLK